MALGSVNLRRDDFVKFSDGSSMFDVILDHLLIPAQKQKEVFEISFQVESFDYAEARKETGGVIKKAHLYTIETGD